MKVAGAISAFLGLGFGLPGAAGLWHFLRTQEVWTFLGFPTYGGGPFERAGVPTSAPLLTTFVLVCAVEVAVGWLLWTGSRAGAWAALALLPVELVFWVGFALPFGPLLGLARTAAVVIALVAAGRSSA